MKIYKMLEQFVGTLKITGVEGGYFATGKTFSEVVLKLLTYAKLGGELHKSKGILPVHR